jgi:hypothetical protein
MKQEQSIGSHNQQQGLPEKRNQDTRQTKTGFQPELDKPVKPAITDDEGNLQSKNSNTAKGYSEPKPTEAWSTEKSPEEKETRARAPENQSPATEKVYGDGHHEHVFEEHPPLDEKRENQLRRQAGEAQG